MYDVTGTFANIGNFTACFNSVNYFVGQAVNIASSFPSYDVYDHDYTALNSTMNFGSSYSTVLGGSLSSMSARGYFITATGDPGGALDKFTTCRLLPAQDDGAQPFLGTVTTLVGLEIGDQKHYLLTKATGQSYGIQQLGTEDENKFFGNMNLQKVISNGSLADDTAAAAAGVPVGGLYHTAGAIKIRIV